MNKLEALSRKIDALGGNKESTNPGSRKKAKHEHCFKHCWTCVRTNDKNHTSATCPKPKEGRVKTATI